MAVNLNVVGKPIPSPPFRYGPDQVILYALGIGAGPEDIEFIYEKGLKVYPTFAVVPGGGPQNLDSVLSSDSDPNGRIRDEQET
jgi:hypothetical protein